MDMSSMASSTAMMMSGSTSTAAAMSSSTSSMDMGGMDMGMGGDSSCKISMLWNWYTVDACFLSETWHVRSAGAFAGSCIGVIILVMALEALRRVAREYEAHIVRKRIVQYAAPGETTVTTTVNDATKGDSTIRTTSTPTETRTFTPKLLEQLTRALLHMLQFAVAYFIMLLAMYFNGYIIICIFIGAFLGAFVFDWRSVGLPGSNAQSEITYCCG